jgi:hypothetical protein
MGERCGVFLQDGAEFLDVSDPSDPVLVSKYTNAAPHAVYYDGVYAYLADQDKEFILVDLANPHQGYAVRTPNIDWLWAVPITLFSMGISILIVPFLRGNQKGVP